MANATMARTRPGKTMSGKSTPDVNVRISSEAAKLARMVSSFEDRSMSDVISEIVVPVLEKRYEELLKRAQHELASKPKIPKR